MKKYFLLLFLFSLFSCVTTSNISQNTFDKKTINKESARLIFKREKAILFFGVDVLVEVNGQMITKLSNGSSFSYDVPANDKTIIKVEGNWNPGKFPLIIKTEKGKIYEFLIEPSIDTKYGSIFKIVER